MVEDKSKHIEVPIARCGKGVDAQEHSYVNTKIDT